MSNQKMLSDYKLTLTYEETPSASSPHSTKIEFICDNPDKEEILVAFYKLMAYMGMPLIPQNKQTPPDAGDLH